MNHIYFLFARKPSVDRRTFHRHYLEIHPLQGGRPYHAGPTPTLPRYIQNHRLHSLGGDCIFDGLSEIWSTGALVGEPEELERSKAFLRDEDNFMHPGKKCTISTNDHIIVEAESRRSGMISATFLLRRALELTLAEFRDYWFNVHAAIAKTIPGLKHYQICPVVDGVYMSYGGWGDPRWDGVEQILFDNYESAKAAIESSEFNQSFLSDLRRFSETQDHFFSDVHMMAWPGRTEEQAKREVMEKLERGWRD
ncbi:MAG TPA: EthD family reductase [Candidatus Binataceae bacterium]|jgi:uncharacterized protein (TIGR02118 family)|nr:EthD family reductase [Candidatus Binataceae bacterium]